LIDAIFVGVVIEFAFDTGLVDSVLFDMLISFGS
jgi:hypothetical protein